MSYSPLFFEIKQRYKIGTMLQQGNGTPLTPCPLTGSSDLITLTIQKVVEIKSYLNHFCRKIITNKSAQTQTEKAIDEK
jgi:hypothetical protein